MVILVYCYCINIAIVTTHDKAARKRIVSEAVFIKFMSITQCISVQQLLIEFQTK